MHKKAIAFSFCCCGVSRSDADGLRRKADRDQSVGGAAVSAGGTVTPSVGGQSGGAATQPVLVSALYSCAAAGESIWLPCA